jgi:Fur family transcriptional regulator, ferric uptake regulator
MHMQNNQSQEWLDKLQQSGYRATARCAAIVEVILSSQRALDPVDIFDAVRKRYPGLGLVTVYRTIQKLEELGLLQRLHHDQGCHQVLPATQGHQHYLVCTSCGEVRRISGDDLESLFLQIAERTGYRILDHLLQLDGVCPRCQTLVSSSN